METAELIRKFLYKVNPKIGYHTAYEDLSELLKEHAIEFEEYCLQYPDWEKETEEIYNEWKNN